MRNRTIGIFLSVVSLAAIPASAQNEPGQIRTSTGIPMRTGIGQPMRTSTGGPSLVPLQPGLGYPAYYNGYGYGSGSSLSVNGDGYSINVNGSLAQTLAYNTWSGSSFGFGHGSDTCLAVDNADAILPNLPAYVRDHATVLRGEDYGWSYDVICLPGGGGWHGGYPSYGYGWYPTGYTYYPVGQSNIAATSGWNSLSQTQQQIPPQPVTPPEAIDIARVALVLGNLDSAEEQYRIHLNEHPDDSAALREFALVMFEADRVDDGFAALRKAYRDQPELAIKPLDLGQFGFDGPRTRRLMAKVSPVANNLKTSSGWLALTALLQWQGKDRAAIRMLEKAEAMGLESEIVTPFRSDLTS